MKKLMIAACAMAMAVAAQAANVTWSSAAVVFGAGTTTRIDGGLSAYLISASDWSRTQLLTDFNTFGGTAAAFASSTAWKSAAQIASTTTSANGKIASKPYTSAVLPSVAGTKDAYFVIVSGDNLYLTGEQTQPYVSVGDKYTFAFTTTEEPALSGQQALMDRSKGLQGEYNGAGWYGNVPEPTSGLLLLLGVAGLALRRRRA